MTDGAFAIEKNKEDFSSDQSGEKVECDICLAGAGTALVHKALSSSTLLQQICGPCGVWARKGTLLWQEPSKHGIIKQYSFRLDKCYEFKEAVSFLVARRRSVDSHYHNCSGDHYQQAVFTHGRTQHQLF